jgi:hypothetical protein
VTCGLAKLFMLRHRLVLAGEVPPKRTKLPAATARSAAFKTFDPADAVVLQLNSELNPFVGLFRPSLIDPALPQTAWTALDGLRALAALPVDAADSLFYTVHARRTRNPVMHALRGAMTAFNDVSSLNSAASRGAAFFSSGSRE